MLKGIIFDFDGVIAESACIKSDAFMELYEPFGKDVAQKVVEHHEINDAGMSRFELFRYYHKTYLDIELSRKEEKKYINRFSKIVIEKIIKVPYVPGVIEFIDSCLNKYQLFISTGTPINEIKKILSEREINHYFNDIRGAPENKFTQIRKIMKENGFKSKELLFYGDSIIDHKAAKENDINFILRKHKNNIHVFNHYKGKSITDFNKEFV